jgi:hypothetical protein
VVFDLNSSTQNLNSTWQLGSASILVVHFQFRFALREHAEGILCVDVVCCNIIWCFHFVKLLCAIRSFGVSIWSICY